MVSYIGPDSQLISSVINWENIRRQVTRLMNECLVNKSKGGVVIAQSDMISPTLLKPFFTCI